MKVHAAAAEFSEMDGMAAVGTREKWAGGEAQRGRAVPRGWGVDAVVGSMLAAFGHPVDEVLAAVSTGCFGAGGDGEVDFPAGIVQFLAIWLMSWIQRPTIM